eukprot:3269694-Amphidinium_carterae.1
MDTWTTLYFVPIVGFGSLLVVVPCASGPTSNRQSHVTIVDGLITLAVCMFQNLGLGDFKDEANRVNKISNF